MTDNARRNHRRVNRDHWCHYCGAPATTADHVVPKIKGGPGAQWNLVPACQPCNHRKSDQGGWCHCEFCDHARMNVDRLRHGLRPILLNSVEIALMWARREANANTRETA